MLDSLLRVRHWIKPILQMTQLQSKKPSIWLVSSGSSNLKLPDSEI